MDLIIDGRYQLLKRLDHDESSALYVASDLQTGRVACLRMWSAGPRAADYVVTTPPGDQPQLKAADDPRVVSPYDWGVDKEVVYLARDFVPGRSLTDLVEQEGPLSVAVATGLAVQIAEAVASAHGQDLTHGKIRPSQVVVGDDGHVHLLGFEESTPEPAPPRRESPPIRGFAPRADRGLAPAQIAEDVADQAIGSTERQRQHDVYALGALYMFMLTGDDRLTQPAFLQSRARPSPTVTLQPSLKRQTLPRFVDDAVAYATSRDSLGRLPTAGEVAERFRGVEQRVKAARHQAARHPIGDAPGAGGLTLAARQAWRSLADVQGHLAIALLIALAAGLFALTVDRGASGERATAATPTVPPVSAAAPAVQVATAAPTAIPTAAPTEEPTVAPAVVPAAAPSPMAEAPPTRVPTIERTRVSQASAPRRASPTVARGEAAPTLTFTPRVEATATHTALPKRAPTVAARKVVVESPTPRPAATVVVETTPPPNLATPAPRALRGALAQP